MHMLGVEKYGSRYLIRGSWSVPRRACFPSGPETLVSNFQLRVYDSLEPPNEDPSAGLSFFHLGHNAPMMSPIHALWYHLVDLFLTLGGRLTETYARSFSILPDERLEVEELCGLLTPTPHKGSSDNGRELGCRSSNNMMRSGARCAKHCSRTRA